MFLSNSANKLYLYVFISLVLMMVIFLIYNYQYPFEDFTILYPKNNDKIPALETLCGTKTYDPLCPFVVVYVKDNSGVPRPFRITDVNQIDDVGTWSLQARIEHVQSTMATLFVGLSSFAPTQLYNPLPKPPQLQHVRSISVYVVHQPSSLRPD
jgi:hypothetical protein